MSGRGLNMRTHIMRMYRQCVMTPSNIHRKTLNSCEHVQQYQTKRVKYYERPTPKGNKSSENLIESFSGGFEDSDFCFQILSASHYHSVCVLRAEDERDDTDTSWASLSRI